MKYVASHLPFAEAGAGEKTEEENKGTLWGFA
jgi:hypothetical protein